MAVSSRFTRIPKVHDLILAGIPTEVIATYAALADYSNNKTGLCWPRMETLARTLSRSPRTVQRHLHLLKEKGLIEFVERKRDRHGRFGAYVYRVLHVVAATARKGAEEASNRRERRRKNRPTTGHGGPMAPNKGLTKHREDPPTPQKDRIDGYWWLLAEEPPPGADEQHRQEDNERREQAARRRTEGFDWLFE